jgi:hypothetical protein
LTMNHAYSYQGHGEYDRKRREFIACIHQSKVNANTRGTKFEIDVEELLTQGDGIDGELMELETMWRSSKVLEPPQIERLQVLCTDLAELIKHGSKKMNALMAWMKI